MKTFISRLEGSWFLVKVIVLLFYDKTSSVGDAANKFIHWSWKCKYIPSPLSFCWNLFCASALPWLKPRLIAFISVVWYHNRVETHTHTHLSYYTRYTVYQIKMNLHVSKWDRPNWQWGFNAVLTACCMQGLLSWNQTALHSNRHITERNVNDKEPFAVLLAGLYTQNQVCVRFVPTHNQTVTDARSCW